MFYVYCVVLKQSLLLEVYDCAAYNLRNIASVFF